MFGNVRKDLAAATLFNVIGIGFAAGWEGLRSLQPPRDSETLVNQKPDPRVGEVVTAHNVNIRLDWDVFGGGRRMPIGTASVLMNFTDEHGRDMTAVLNTVDLPAQPTPSVKDFDGYNVEGCKLRIESIGRGGLIKVTKP